jgi:hypothetical protein
MTIREHGLKEAIAGLAGFDLTDLPMQSDVDTCHFIIFI